MNVFRGALDLWILTWKENRKLFWIELIGSLIGIVCATIINAMSAHPPMLIVISGYCVSAILLATASYIRKSPFMILLMSYYTLSSMYGLYNLLF